MNNLTRFELKKIIKRKSTIGSIAVVLVAFIINLTFSVLNESNGSNLTGDLKRGISAISQRRVESEKLKGYLTEKRISEIINIYNDLEKKYENMSDFDGLSEDAYYTHWQKYKDIDYLIDRSYGESLLLGVDASSNLKQEEGAKFYSNRKKQISNYIRSEYSVKEKDKIMEITDKMEIPLYYNYTDGWFKLLWDMSLFSVVSIICVCVCIAPIFSSECEEQIDSIILSTKHGKDKLIKSKFKASFIFTTIFYFVSVALIAAIRLFIYGFDGWNCKVQVVATYWHSMYNINFLQAFLFSVTLGYIACLSTASIAMFISSKLKKSFTVVIATLGLLFIPRLINTVNMPRFIKCIVDLFPINAANINNTLGYYKFYNIFGVLVIQSWIMIVVYIILTVSLLIFTDRAFRNYEVV